MALSDSLKNDDSFLGHQTSVFMNKSLNHFLIEKHWFIQEHHYLYCSEIYSGAMYELC